MCTPGFPRPFSFQQESEFATSYFPRGSLPRNSAFNLARLWLLKVKVELLSHVRLFASPWTVARQASLSMGFSRQEYWSGLPFPCTGDLPDPGIEPGSATLQADSLLSEPQGSQALEHRLNSCGTGAWCSMVCGIFPDQGLKPHLLCLLHRQAFFTTEPPGKPLVF